MKRHGWRSSRRQGVSLAPVLVVAIARAMAVSTIRGRIPPDLVLAFVLLVTMVAASLAFTRQQASDVTSMARRVLMQREISEVLAAARDGESGQRGYLLNGDGTPL